MIKNKNDDNDNHDNHNSNNHKHKIKIKKYCQITKACISIVKNVINMQVTCFQKN